MLAVAQGKNVVQAADVLKGEAKTGQRTVVVGGRYLGIEVAIMLAEQGKHVSLVTERNLGQNSRYMDHYKLLALRDKLVEQGVYFYPHSPALEIYEDGIYIMNGVDARRPGESTSPGPIPAEAEDRAREGHGQR